MWEQRDWIFGTIIASLTFLFTKGFPALLTLLKFKATGKKAQAAVEAKGYNAVIVRLDARVLALEQKCVVLEEKLDKTNLAHTECLIKQAALQTKVDQLEKQLEEA